MDDFVDESTPEQSSAATGQSTAAPASYDADKIDPKRKALVEKWIGEVKKDKKHFKKEFERMTLCEALAEQGAEDVWVADDKKYVVPILTRHINQSVAQLYAKDPRAQAKRRHRRMNTVWDGTISSLQQAQQAAQAHAQAVAMAQQPQPAQMGHNGGPSMPPQAPAVMPPDLDPNVMAIIADAERVRAYDVMIDGLAKTMELLWAYYVKEQSSGYKQQFKALVRRTKVNSVGYVKLGYQRVLEKPPEITAKIEDVTAKIAAVEASLARMASENAPNDDSADVEQLRLDLRDLHNTDDLIVREGPVFDFPKADEIIPHRKCRHLKTLVGADYYTHEFDMTAEDVLETYKVDLKGVGAAYVAPKASSGDGSTKNDPGESTYKVWEIHDKRHQQVLTVCDGYCDFLREPAPPDVRLSRFWNLFPLVFNEIESKKKIYPLSDVWLARHPQAEMNRSRQARREHRIQNLPTYVGAAGVLSDDDIKKLENKKSGQFLQLQGLLPGQDVEKAIQMMKYHPLDPALYNTDSEYEDVLRAVGSTESNLGQPNAGVTATAESIASSGRSASASDNVDDLDDMLSELAQATGELMLIELAKDTVVEIVGPGAVWPDIPTTRDEVSKDIMLDIRAGSSGRPNRAAELANFQRAMPFILQIPGLPSAPFAEKYCDLLEVDLEDGIVEGLPSMTARNQMVGSTTQMAGGGVPGPQGAAPAMGPGQDPNAQGPQGAQNAPQPQGAAQPPPALHPAPMPVG